MALSDSSMVLKIAAVLLAVTLLAVILETALPYWTFVSVGTASNYGGLWQVCSSTAQAKVCTSYSDLVTIPDWLKAVRAFEILGILAASAAVGTAGYAVLAAESNMTKMAKLGSFLSSFAACGCVFIGVFIFVAKAADTSHLGAAFYLAIVAAVMALTAALMTLLDWMGKCQ